MGDKRTEIVVIGAAIVDVLVYPVSAEVFQTGSCPAGDIRMSVGADALNEATILARLGKCVRLETVLGDDEAGSLLQKHIKEEGIEIPDDCVRKKLTTGINVVLVEEGGKRNFLTNPQGSLRSLTLSDIHLPFPKPAKIVCFASIFVFPRIKTEELCILFAQAKRQGKILCADMTKCKNNETIEEMAPAFAFLDYLFPNEEEAMLLTGKGTAPEAAEAILETGVKNVVIKCGAAGCLVKNREEEYQVLPQENVSCIDTTGAGDSFVAGFLYALLEGKNLRECAAFANECGGRAAACVGATEWLNA